MTDDLVAWLRAQLDTDESNVYSRRATVHAMTCDGFPVAEGGYADAKVNLETDNCTCAGPQERLAEVEAKRRILDLHQRVDARDDWVGRGRPDWPAEPACYGCHANFGEEYYEPDANNCEVVRLLALPYADQPGYDERWRSA